MLQTALEWLQKGIAVIPIWYKSKRPALQSWIEYQSELPTEKQVTNWFSHRFRNLGIVTGWQNLVVIDLDNLDKYSEWLQWAIQGEGALVAQYCLAAVTARGVHIYVYCANAQNMKLEGVDIKACGGYVLAPPSLHPSGVQYTWLNNGPIMEVSSIEAILPDTWLAQHNTEPLQVQNTQTLDPWEIVGNRQQIGMGVISRIKNTVKITDLLPAEKSTNGWYTAWCPFHNDQGNNHTKSFWIDGNKGLCGCHACGMKPMDVINLFSRLNGVDNRTAISLLTERI